MASNEYNELSRRVASLKRQFLPPLNPLGEYTSEEQDQMRALRMLVHAEVEAYLEQIAAQLLRDLDSDVRSAKRMKLRFACWAESAAEECRSAISSNNGIKDSDIKKMFGPLGLTQEDYDAISPIFLDRMKTFGKHRGDVAHQSAMRAGYALNRKREESAIDELMLFISKFDRTLITHRLRGFN